MGNCTIERHKSRVSGTATKLTRNNYVNYIEQRTAHTAARAY
jgi:hypothetical protein